MRLAVVVAPSDPRSGEAVARREALAWLRGQLAAYGFDVLIAGGGQDPNVALEKVASRVTSGDVVLVHLSGRLLGGTSLAFGKERSLDLGAMADALGARNPAELAFVAELLHAEDPDDAGGAASILNAAVGALATNGDGPRRPVLAAIRPLAAPYGRLAFTEHALSFGAFETSVPTPHTFVQALHARLAESKETRVLASNVAFSAAGTALAVSAAPKPPQLATTSSRPPPPPPSAKGRRTPDAARPRKSSPPPPPPPRLPRIQPAPQPPPPPPVDPAALLDSQILDAEGSGDWKLAVDLRRVRLGLFQSPGRVVDELVTVAGLLQSRLGDSDAAVAALEQARVLEPTRDAVLAGLRLGYETLGRWASAMEVVGALAERVQSPVERAGLRVAQARIAAEQIGDEAGADRWLHAAIVDDPENSEAKALLTRLLALPMEADGIVEAEPSVELLIHDTGYEEESASGVNGLSIAEVEMRAVRSPFDSEAYSLLHSLSLKAGRLDGAYLAAMALESLNAADTLQQTSLEEWRSVSPVRARASLDEGAWALLRGPGFDDVLAAIFAAVERPAIAARLDVLREQNSLRVLDREQRLGETSTASIVRSFQWAARFLGVGCPDLYVMDEATGCSSIPAVTPSTSLGPDILSGQSAKDLAFLAGHHLARYRPEYHLFSYYPTREDVTMLLFAAAQLGMPARPTDSGGSVASLRGRLARHVSDQERAALSAAVARLDARGGQATIGTWIRSMELTAARVGLLLCGDLKTAMVLLRSPLCAVREPSLDARRGDLISFCSSRSHADLRAKFVATAGASVPPAKPANAVDGG